MPVQSLGLYALPHESVPTIMFVNKALLEENGIEMPDNNWTWEDFYGICAQITDVGERRFGVDGVVQFGSIKTGGLQAQARMDSLLSGFYSDKEIHGVLSPNDGIARAVLSF